MWQTFGLGIVIAAGLTAALMQFFGRAQQHAEPVRAFRQVATSVLLTAVLGGLARTGGDYALSGALAIDGAVFGMGWLLGGLLVAWLLTGQLRER